jgi:hypothetical protein
MHPCPRVLNTLPSKGIAIVMVEVPFVLTGDGFVHIHTRAMLDLVYRQIQVETVSRPLGLAEGDRQDEHPALIEEAPGLDDQIADDPALIVQ